MYEDFKNGYIEALFFTESGSEEDGKEIPEDMGVYDLSEEAQKKIDEDCIDFFMANEALWDSERMSRTHGDRQAGIDFWLSRNGHGAGFFDGPLPNGDKLQAAAKVYGEVYAYVGDDGKIYIQ